MSRRALFNNVETVIQGEPDIHRHVLLLRLNRELDGVSLLAIDEGRNLQLDDLGRESIEDELLPLILDGLNRLRV